MKNSVAILFFLLIAFSIYFYYNPQTFGQLTSYLSPFNPVNIGKTNLKDLTQHPENYLNQNITVIGISDQFGLKEGNLAVQTTMNNELGFYYVLY